MIDAFGAHRADERQLVGDARRVRQNLGERHAALARRMKLERRGEQVSFLFVKMNFQLAGIGLAVVPRQLRLAIEEIHLARPAMLEKANHGLGLAGNRRRRGAVRAARRGQHIGQCQATERAGVSTEERTPIQGKMILHGWSIDQTWVRYLPQRH